MAQLSEERLLQAVKKDDVKAFHALMETARCGAYRLGRFPVLSLLYLYRARKILSEYEESFLKITNHEPLREPVEVSKKFTAKAGKCLRLYLGETVSPLEMLLILDEAKRLKRVYPLTKPSAAVKARLQSIYSIKYSLGVKFEGDEIIIDRRPLSYREKKKIATACLCSALAVVLTVGVSVTAVALMPPEGEVTKLSQIKFNSTKEYILKQDIVLPENFIVEKMNCKLIGEGHKLILSKGATLGELNGKLSGVTIESAGDAVFTSVSENAAIENVTVNVTAAVTSAEGAAFIAGVNLGTIDGVTVNVGGKLNAVAGENDGTDELVFGGIVQSNAYKSSQSYGIIRNCEVKYSQFQLKGEASANAVFGGVAGENNGILQNCRVTGEIAADTFDIAGVCAVNSGILSGLVNEADLSQVSADTGWNPIVSGIALRNYSAVQDCENGGSVSAVSACPESEEARELTVTAAGIICLNGVGGVVERSENSGKVAAESSGTAYAGGISAVSYAHISYCISSGDITATAKNVYAGGILGLSEITLYGRYVYFGIAESCISEGGIGVTVTGGDTACVGGIAGYIREQKFDNVGYLGGRINNCFFLGECAEEVSRFGNIVGVCGANIYGSNSYVSGNVEYYNFAGNCYLENSLNAFGATVSGDEYAPAEDKGATAADKEEIQNSEAYQAILSAFGK